VTTSDAHWYPWTISSDVLNTRKPVVLLSLRGLFELNVVAMLLQYFFNIGLYSVDLRI